jgi:hypothetical protein
VVHSLPSIPQKYINVRDNLVTICRHAGVFVWVDLRRYIHKSSTSELTSPVVNAERDREVKLFMRFLEADVVISQGSSTRCCNISGEAQNNNSYRWS